MTIENGFYFHMPGNWENGNRGFVLQSLRAVCSEKRNFYKFDPEAILEQILEIDEVASTRVVGYITGFRGQRVARKCLECETTYLQLRRRKSQGIWWATCRVCGRTSPSAMTIQGVIECWNRVNTPS